MKPQILKPGHRPVSSHGLVSTILLAFVMAGLLTGCATSPAPADAPGVTADTVRGPAIDPLPSWNEGPSKARILNFVDRVSDPDHPDFVPVAERIATFDNDGTLWAEQPLYFQLFFAMDQVRAMAPQHPEWQDTEPFRSVLADDMTRLAAQGEQALFPLLFATHSGMSASEFRRSARQWLDTARHPRFDQPFDAMVYQPMLELLELFRDHGFQTWIVSGGGIEFLRAFAEDTYGIPPQQVVGTSLVTRFDSENGEPMIMRDPEVDFIDDKAGKPVGINLHIGRRPIAAFGNSDGDLQMLQWTAAGDGPRLAAFVRHTDTDREWAYDRESHIGRLDQGLDEARDGGWLVIDMARDWSVVFPFEETR